MNHILKRIQVNLESIHGHITPTCSCGWIGLKECNHNDYMYSNVCDQEQAHLRHVEMASTPAGRERIERVIKDCENFINKESLRPADTRPATARQMLDHCIKEKARLQGILEHG